MVEEKRLRFMQRPLIGLDIDASSVRMVRLRPRNGEYIIVAAATSEVAPWDDDPQLHRAHTVEAIRECFEALGAGKRLAVCGLRGSDVVVRGFEFPALAPEETQGAIELETSQMCPFSAEDGSLDYQVTSNHNDKTRGFWVAANYSLIEDKRQLVREAGLQCVLMDVDGLALLNCLETSPDGVSTATGEEADARANDMRPVVLDIGDAHASIAITDHAHRPFIRDVPSGGHDIMRQMAREMRMSLEEVQAALLGDGQGDVTLLSGSLERACTRLLEEIVTTLRYYGSQNRSVRVNKMLVCGSFASARGLLDLFAAKLPIEVVLWNPLGAMVRDVDSPFETLVQKSGSALTVAAGLAMRAI